MKHYVIKTGNGHFVGLFNFGRTYGTAFNKTSIKTTREKAGAIAKAFHGTIIETF